MTPGECTEITDGLKKVWEEWEKDTFTIHPSDEDIHTANERRLKVRIACDLQAVHNNNYVSGEAAG